MRRSAASGGLLRVVQSFQRLLEVARRGGGLPRLALRSICGEASKSSRISSGQRVRQCGVAAHQGGGRSPVGLIRPAEYAEWRMRPIVILAVAALAGCAAAPPRKAQMENNNM